MPFQQQHQTKDSDEIRSKNCQLMIEIVSVFTKSFCLYIINPCQICYGFMKKAFTKTTNTFDKNNRCHTTVGGLSSVCAKLEPARDLEINVLQKLTSYAVNRQEV